MRIQAPVQHLMLTGRGVVPQMPDPYTLKSGDIGFNDNIHLMVSQWALNVDDNVWYYRGRSKIYRINMPTSDMTTEYRTGFEVFDPTAKYLAGDTFVSFASVTPEFQQEHIYRCILNTDKGESPETHPNKWEIQDENANITTITIDDVTNLRTTLNTLISDVNTLLANISVLYELDIVDEVTPVIVIGQEDAAYFINLIKYTADGYIATDMIYTSNQTQNGFNLNCDSDYLNGKLYYTIQRKA